MKKFLRIFLPVLVLGLAIVAFAALVSLGKGRNPERKESGTAAVLVEVETAQVQSLNLTVVSQGAVRPRTETVLVPEVSGRIVNVSPNFVAGGFFRGGEVLLQIDPSDYEAALKRAEANLASRQAQYADQKARSEQALRDWQNLGREGEPSDLTLRKPQLAEALAGVLAAEADLQKARRDLERTRIRLPYDGLVRAKQVDIGQYVSPGTSLGVTFAIDTAEIRLPLTSRDLAFLKLPAATGGDSESRPQVRLSAESSGVNGEWHAEIIRTEGVIDETSRVVYAVAQVVDPYGVLGISDQQVLRVGTFVRAEIEGIPADNVVVLPRAVLRTNDTVLIANESNELEIRPVDLLRSEADHIYVRGGIRDGERVISTPMSAPIPGMRLALTSDETPGAPSDQASLADAKADQ
ncbi:efflux RND transporter periplasmic adaptor subunit [Elongatibacter sediminis]|uniref:Efflux RND transporter periplasmic adaptor subunit n=1 Tax=Elongatibacter sediminis TaxID=3119006 RepID=A0AAW9RFM5_9GAMM